MGLSNYLSLLSGLLTGGVICAREVRASWELGHAKAWKPEKHSDALEIPCTPKKPRPRSAAPQQGP